MHELDEVLQHFGVKGMKWGVRRDASYRKGMKGRDVRKLKKMTSASDRQKYLDEKDTKWLAKVKDDVKIEKVAKATAKDMKKINRKLKKKYGSDARRMFNRTAQSEFQKEMKMAYEDMLSAHTYRVYRLSTSRTREVKIESAGGGTLKAVVVERDTPKLSKQRSAINKSVRKLEKKQAREAMKALQHSDQLDDDPTLDGMFFLITVDDDGFPDDVIDPFSFDEISQNDDTILIVGEQIMEDVLQHWGIKGMKWDKEKKKKDAEAKAEGFLNAKDKAEFEKIVKDKKLTPKQAADLKAFTFATRNNKAKSLSEFAKKANDMEVSQAKKTLAAQTKQEAKIKSTAKQKATETKKKAPKSKTSEKPKVTKEKGPSVKKSKDGKTTYATFNTSTPEGAKAADAYIAKIKKRMLDKKK